MRKRGFITAVVLFVLYAAVGQGQDSVKFGEPMCIGHGAAPQWSPDGSMLAFVDSASLYMTTTPEFKERKLIAVDAAPVQWVGNTGFVWRKRITRQHDGERWDCVYVYTSDLAGNVELLDSDSTYSNSRSFGRIGKLMPSVDGTIAYHEILNGDEHNTRPKILRQTALLKPASPAAAPRRMAFSRSESGPFGDIWLADLDGGNQRQVTHGPDTWMWALLSPNQELIATTNHLSQIVFLDTLGITVANAGGAEVGGWSPDSKRFLTWIGEEGEFEITGSELYIYHIDSQYRQQLTDTPDLIEFSPCWSPTGDFIAYAALNTREIFIIRVEAGK